MFYFALRLLLFHFLACSICSVEIDAVQQRLAAKIEIETRPVEMVSLIRVEAIRCGDRGQDVPQP